MTYKLPLEVHFARSLL
ncbi:MAG: hypothetical protein AB8U53_07620 [Rickettsia aeschlimannii]